MPLLALKGITRHFRDGQIKVEALRGIDLTVDEGEFVSIMGPSGSGKSTLLNILGCLDKPTSGKYQLADQEVQRFGDGRLAELRNHFIGFVFQTFHLVKSMDAQANVELPLIYRGLGAGKRRRRAVAALEAVGLADRIHHRPAQLSGGEQQRVAIARALVGEPAMILADEPTGALDSKSGETIMSIFQNLNESRGLTIIQVTHDDNIARHAHRVVRLLDGRIEAIEEVSDRRMALPVIDEAIVVSTEV